MIIFMTCVRFCILLDIIKEELLRAALNSALITWDSFLSNALQKASAKMKCISRNVNSAVLSK